MRIQVMRPPQMENTASVLDGLLDDDQEEDQDYHPIKNGLKRKSLDMEPSMEQLESNGKRLKLEKPLEVKGLLGNSLGSYWNDGTMMVEKRRRKQVIRFTQDDKKDDEEDDSPKRRKKIRNTSVEGEKLNLKKRARQVKEEVNGGPTVNPYMLFENGTADSTLDTSIESELASEDEPVLTGSKKRKCHTPYTKNPISVACHMARKPVQNFNLCPYKQPSRLLKDCAQFLLKDHSSIPLVLALDMTELIHVTEYKALLQSQKTTKFKRKQPQKPQDIDNLRPGYSRAKEDLKQFLCSITVERSMHAQQRRQGICDPHYQAAKRELIDWLEEHHNS